MVVEPVNASGWTELYNGQLIQAAYKMYDTALTVHMVHFFVFTLFIVFQFMVIIKTKNLTVAWVSGIFFMSLYATSIFISAVTLQFMFLLIVFELAGILYYLIFK